MSMNTIIERSRDIFSLPSMLSKMNLKNIYTESGTTLKASFFYISFDVASLH